MKKGEVIVVDITISALEKKEFIQWFLNHYKLKRRECVWLLNFIISDEELLENVHFVEHAEYCPKAIIMSSECVDGISFQFFKKHAMTTEPEKSFHDIRLYREEELYIQLNFKRAISNPEYAAVLEENPYYTPEVSKKYGMDARDVLDEAERAFQKQSLLRKIDQALVEGDKQAFYVLTEELNTITPLGG
jgi:uncharacterized protein YpiB (UPF0302 family)